MTKDVDFHIVINDDDFVQVEARHSVECCTWGRRDHANWLLPQRIHIVLTVPGRTFITLLSRSSLRSMDDDVVVFHNPSFGNAFSVVSRNRPGLSAHER